MAIDLSRFTPLNGSVGLDSLDTDISDSVSKRRPSAAVSSIRDLAIAEGADAVLPVIEAIYGQESGSGANGGTSIDGARGGMQVMPATFSRYAKPGERIDDPNDNLRVGVRIIKDLATKFGNDPARIATGYFSGEGNVNAAGNQAWKRDAKDGNGKSVSDYVGDVLGRLGVKTAPAAAEAPAADLSAAPIWADVAKSPEFNALPLAERQQLKTAYYDKWVAPSIKDTAVRERFLDSIDQTERSWGEAASDTGAQLAEGVNTILGAVPQLVAPDSGVAQFFGDNADYWRDKQSNSLQANIADAGQRIDTAGEDGVLSQIASAAGEYFTDPALAARFVTTNLPSMIPGIAAAKIGQAAALARGATAAKAAKVGATAAGVSNAALNAGGARGDSFDEIRETLIKQGMSPEAATDAALQDSRVAAAVGGLAGFVSGKTGLEHIVAGGAGRGGVRAGLASGLSELAGEQLEEVSPQIAGNVMAGQYDDRSALKDVGRTVVETAIGSGPGSVVAGVGAGLGGDAQRPAAPAPAAAPTPSPKPAAAPTPAKAPEHSTTHAAAAVVADMAAEAGMANPLTPELSPADQDALDFAETRREQLLLKRDGTSETVMTDAGLREQDVAGAGLSPAELQELAMLETAGGDVAAIKQFYFGDGNGPQEAGQEERQSGEERGQGGLGSGAVSGADSSAGAVGFAGIDQEGIADAGGPSAGDSGSGGGSVGIIGGDGGRAAARDVSSADGQPSAVADAGLSVQPESTAAGARPDGLGSGGDASTGTDLLAESDADREARVEREAIQAEGDAVEDLGADVPFDLAPAHEAATSPLNDLPEPTPAQKEAGNYKKGHIKFAGLDLTIENPTGSKRSGTDPNGAPWSVDMTANYGYIKRTEGADGEQVDVYLAEQPSENAPVVVFDQYNADGTFDEHKAVLGATPEQAAAIYDAHFSDGSGPSRRKAFRQMSVSEFKDWLNQGDTRNPVVPRTEKQAKAKREAKAAFDAAMDQAAKAADRVLSAEDERQLALDEKKPYRTEREAREAKRVEAARKKLAEQESKNGEIDPAQVPAASDGRARDNASGSARAESSDADVVTVDRPSGDTSGAVGGVRAAEPVGDAKPEPAPALKPKTEREAKERRAAAVLDSDAAFEVKLARVGNFLETTTLPDYAKQAVVSHERMLDTNNGVDAHLTDAEWEVREITLDSLKPQNEMLWGNTFVHRGSVTKGPIVLDRAGEVIDGNNRTHEAIRRGDKTIEAYIPSSGNANSAAPAPKTEKEAKARRVAANVAKAGGQGEATNGKDSFAFERYDRETEKVETLSFARGEYVRYRLNEKGADLFGDIEGISHANEQFKVDGLWYPFQFAYKAERPAPAAPKNAAPLSAVVDAVNAKNGTGLTEADRVPTAPKPLVAQIDEAISGARDGTITPAQFIEAFGLVADRAADVKAELSKKTKEKLLENFNEMGRARYKNDNKDIIVGVVYESMVREFALGKSYGPSSYTMSRGGLERYEAEKLAALRVLVEAQTPESLAEYASEIKKLREEAVGRRAERMEALKNPKTLSEFSDFIGMQMREGKTQRDARLALTTEQRAEFDRLWAERNRAARGNVKEASREIRVAGQKVDAEIIATKHTKKGHDLYVVRLGERVPREDYETLNTAAKRMGGYYSSFRGNGAIPGFQFTDRGTADAFVKLANGDAADAQQAAQQRRDAFDDDRSQSAVERLTEMADRLDERADESLSIERKANTARRARFANSAEAAARADKALAKTMRNIASAIGESRANFLDRVRMKSQVELLEGAIRTAKDTELRNKYDSYGEQQKRQGEPATADTVEFVEFPSFTMYRSDLATLARQLSEVDGLKQIGERLGKFADDVTDEYTKFAKENFHKIAPYAFKDGGRAVYPRREDAERAIKRSNLRGKAIVLPVARGQNAIVMSPGEAQARGIWQGDGDKRLSIKAEIGGEIVEKLKGRKDVAAPWQFVTAHDRLKALARIGIESGAEYRTALREFINLREQAIEADRVKQMERAMIGRRKDGLDFFPTPADTADAMIDAAELTPEMTVLEPSAGMGHIADRIRAAGAEPDVVELSGDRRKLLEAKGYTVIGSDFMEIERRKSFTFGDTFRAADGTEGVMRGKGGMGSNRVRLEGENGTVGYFDRDELTPVRHNGYRSGYDRIILNPPFSDGRDMLHVRHAYDLLKPGGRLVAIMGEGAFFRDNKQARDFREWMEKVGGTDEKLAEGTFEDPTLPVNTSVAARMVVIEKPEDDAAPADAPTFENIARAPTAHFEATPAPVRADALARLKRLESKRDTGKLTEAEYRLGVQMVIDKLETRNAVQADRRAVDRRRGAAWIVAQLRRGVADDKVPVKEADFAEWLLDQNPDLARDLGISITEKDGEGTAGVYNPYARIVRLFSGSLGDNTGVHEILHHTERMMPEEVQAGIVKAWKRARADAYKAASPNVRAAMDDMLAASLGDKAAHEQAKIAFGNGTLNYDDHYHLYSPSEFWAVNATKILDGRFAVQGSWPKRALQWLKEFVQRVRDYLRLKSDAPILRAFDAVVGGDGTFQSKKMLSERRDVTTESSGAPAPRREATFAQIDKDGTFDRTLKALGKLKDELRDATGSGLATRAADAFLNQPLKNAETGVVATVSRGALGKMLSASAVKNSTSPQAHAMAVANLDKLFPLAIRRLQRADNAADPSIAAIHHFDVPMPFGDDVLRVKMLVKEMKTREQGNRLYTVSAIQIEKPASVRGEAAPEGSYSPTPPAGLKSASVRGDADSLETQARLPAPPAGFNDRFAQMVDAVNAADQDDGFTHANFVRKTQDAITKFVKRPVDDQIQTFNWYDKSFATQYHKALKDADFGRVFNLANAMQNEISLLSLRPSEVAPDVLPRVDNIKTAMRTLAKGQGNATDLGKAAEALFQGTLAGKSVLTGKVWDDGELQLMGLSPGAIGIYRQARKAIDASLDEVAASEAFGMAQYIVTKAMRPRVIDDPRGAPAALLKDIDKRVGTITRAINAAKLGGNDDQASNLEAVRANYIETRNKIDQIVTMRDGLQDAGYAPLMRFGKFSVTVFEVDPATGETVLDDKEEPVVLSFAKFETEGEAKAERDRLRRKNAQRPDRKIVVGAVSQKASELYNGVSPETLELFAEAVGAETATRTFIELAAAERSALKRRLSRKGTTGYSEDLPRVLAQFITSNARHAAQRYYLREMNQAVKRIPQTKGDVRDEAIALKNFVVNPDDAGSGLSSLMFVYYLGGSIASAAVNMTQPITMTGPYLAQFGADDAAEQLAKAIPLATGAKEISNANLKKDLRRASLEGVVDAQEVFHLYSIGSRGVASGLVRALTALPGVGDKVQKAGEDARARMQAGLTLWGSLFAAAEGFNRRLTFIAAYNMATKQGRADPYAFAVRAVNETQGIYNKVNRSNFARNRYGRAILTFKQFQFMYLELGWRSIKTGGPGGRKTVALMGLTLLMLSGFSGLWGTDDLDDLIDTIGQWLKYDTNMKRDRRRLTRALLGEILGDVANYGVSTLLPLDFAGRLGMGNIIPGTAVFKPAVDEDRKGREIAEAFGPAVGLLGQGLDMAEAADGGKLGQAARAIAPKAINNLFAGLDMAVKGYATDTRGRRTVDTDLIDAAMKAIGFNPTVVADKSRATGPIYQDIALQKKRENEVVESLARAAIDGDEKATEEAIQKALSWNERNPNLPINPTGSQVKSRIRMLLSTKDERLMRQAPREIRTNVAEGLDLVD